MLLTIDQLVGRNVLLLSDVMTSLILFALLETGMNTLHLFVIYFLNGLMISLVYQFASRESFSLLRRVTIWNEICWFAYMKFCKNLSNVKRFATSRQLKQFHSKTWKDEYWIFLQKLGTNILVECTNAFGCFLCCF